MQMCSYCRDLVVCRFVFIVNQVMYRLRAATGSLFMSMVGVHLVLPPNLTSVIGTVSPL
jgi:hypothetical protein